MSDSSTSEVYEESLQRRLENTCDWIFERPQYLGWVSADFDGNTPKLLWIHGPAGFGKTILCSQITRQVSSLPESQTSSTAHFFLSIDLENRTDPNIILRSWISQVISSKDLAFTLTMNEMQKQQTETASRISILKLFSKIIQAIPRCTFIVDGLDECTSPVDGFLADLKGAVAGSSTRLLIVSRDVGEIREALTNNNAGKIAMSEYKLSAADTEADIARYSRSVVDDKLSNKALAVREDISDKMAQRCQGQFLWLKLQGHGLRRGMNKKQLQNAVNETPIGLDLVYTRNWEKIIALPEYLRDRAVSLLRWTTFAIRPLTVSEITEAVLVDIENEDDDMPIDLTELPDSIDRDYINTEIIGLCYSLLEVRPRNTGSEGNTASWKVHLTHFSVKEFLLPNLASAASVPCGVALTGTKAAALSGESNAHAILAEICLFYMQFPRIWQVLQGADVLAVSANGAEYKPGSFLKYAARYWRRHFELSSNDGEIPDYVTVLFDRAHPAWDHWTQWHDRKLLGLARAWVKEEKDVRAPGPLYYAALTGFPKLVQLLLDRGEDAAEASFKGRTAISGAATRGFTEIVKMLLAAGASARAMNDFGKAPIHGAVGQGHVDTVKLLLDNGADPLVANQKGETPLMMACKYGYIDIVKLIIEAGVDIQQTTSIGVNASHYASTFGQVETLKFLLDRRVDITLRAPKEEQPLHLACHHAHEQAVALLISHGADVNSPMAYGCSPLHLASRSGNAGIVKQLLEAGAVIDTGLSLSGDTPLMWACTAGHLEIVKLLVEAGADIFRSTKAKGRTALTEAVESGRTDVVEYLVELGMDVNHLTEGTLDINPLQLAASKGNKEMLQFLLSKGADLQRRNKRGHVACHTAILSEQFEIARLLLDRGTDLESTDKMGHTPLHYAGLMGNLALTGILLDKGSNLESKSNSGLTPLHCACKSGHVECAELLIRKGAKVDSRGVDGDEPIYYAAKQGHVDIIQLLVTHGASPDGHPDARRSPLHYAALLGHTEMANFLLDQGAHLERQDRAGDTPLLLAAWAGKIEVAQALLDRGADVERKNMDGQTPLHAAFLRGHPKVAKILIERGANLNCTDNKGLQALQAAARPNYQCKLDLAITPKLIPRPPNPNGPNLAILVHTASDHLIGRTRGLIHYVAADGNTEAVRKLVDRGENLDMETRLQKHTPLGLACVHERVETAELLLERGARIDKSSARQSFAPLLMTAEGGSVAILKMLLEKGANMEACTISGENAFIIACQEGHLDAVDFLCQYTRENPDASAIGPSSWDDNHRTGLFWAALFGFDELADYLCSDERVDPTIEDWYGNSPLVAAAANGHTKVVKVLLSRCSTWVTPRDEKARLLWKRAKGSGDTEILRLVGDYLRAQGANFDDDSHWVDEAAPAQQEGEDFCDGCTLTIPNGQERWKCWECDDGDFRMCDECYELGLRCRSGWLHREMVMVNA